jgi:hypothetical protein
MCPVVLLMHVWGVEKCWGWNDVCFVARGVW